MAKTTTNTNKLTPSDLKQDFGQVNNFLDDLFLKKFPAIPANIKEVIVKYGPYITLVILILSLPALLFAFGLGTILAPLSYLGGVSSGFHVTLTLLFSLAGLVLEALSLPGLFARKRSGWNLAYYAAWLNIVSSVVTGNIIGALISFAITFWILYQIREYYT